MLRPGLIVGRGHARETRRAEANDESRNLTKPSCSNGETNAELRPGQFPRLFRDKRDNLYNQTTELAQTIAAINEKDL